MDYCPVNSSHEKDTEIERGSNYGHKDSICSEESGRRRTNKIVLCQSVTNNSAQRKEVDGGGKEIWKEVDRNTWVERDIQQYEWRQNKPPEVNFILNNSSMQPIMAENPMEVILDKRMMGLVGENNELVLASSDVKTSPVLTWSEVDAVTISQPKGSNSHGSTTTREGSIKVLSEEAVWKVTPKNNTHPTATSFQNQPFSSPSGRSSHSTNHSFSSNSHPPQSHLQYMQSAPVCEDEYAERREYRRCLNRNLMPSNHSKNSNK